ncbi:Rop family plasmid primer RNA-binding protein, partial [Klebsiella pneumoniae]|uniref:Rop family plasmid primer RNA-binding protein n=1 Tax=Klebsiella pneumoniae TaxID=573 RepID=UPI0032162B04
MSERGSGKEEIPTLTPDALRPLTTKQQKTALNMDKFIQNQSLHLRERIIKKLQAGPKKRRGEKGGGGGEE